MSESRASAEKPKTVCRLGTAAVALAALLVGIVLFLPWETVWDYGLHRLAARLPDGEQARWQSIDRAGPLGFRINGLSAQAPDWPFAPRLVSLDVRLGISPRFAFTADTGGRKLEVLSLADGSFRATGAVDLSCLGRSDIDGVADVRCTGRFRQEFPALDKAFLDIRGKSLKLPGGLLLGDAALSLEYAEGALRIRSFSLRSPVRLHAQGTAVIAPGALPESSYAVTGELLRGRASWPFSARGSLRDFLGDATSPGTAPPR